MCYTCSSGRGDKSEKQYIMYLFPPGFSRSLISETRWTEGRTAARRKRRNRKNTTQRGTLTPVSAKTEKKAEREALLPETQSQQVAAPGLTRACLPLTWRGGGKGERGLEKRNASRKVGPVVPARRAVSLPPEKLCLTYHRFAGYKLDTPILLPSDSSK